MAGNIAYVQDADDDANSGVGEKRYARSIAPGSPTKEKANSGKYRGKDMMRRSSSPQHGQTDSDDTVNPAAAATEKRERARRRKELEEKEARKEERRRAEKERDRAERRERERERPASKKPAVRPTPKHIKTAPVVHTQNNDEYRRPRFEDEAAQYGIPTPAQAHRPGAMPNRPHSYYYGQGQGSRPPPSNERFYAAQASPSPFAPMPQHSPFPPEQSYSQQGWPQGMPYPGQAPLPPPSGEYFPPPHPIGPGPVPVPGQSNLAHRFRPSSAMGYRSMSGSFDDPYEKENMPRRRSVKIRNDDARRLMPPPPRPKSSAPSRHSMKPPPQPRQIEQTAYDYDDLDDESTYDDVIPYEYDDGVVERPPAHRRGSSAYSRDAFRIEPAPSGRNRRSSMAGSAPKYEAAENAAMAYQNGVNGAPVRLTAAALKANKKSKSSRSSGSSESRDESEFRQSATTRTTRSSALDSEDVTIKVTGSAVLKIGNAEIQCQDGGEINITQGGRLGGSDKASTIYSDDRQSRKERLPIRDRASSNADSYSRVSSYDYYPQGRLPFS